MIDIGVDPGLEGAIAIIKYPEIIAIYDMPLLEIEVGNKDRNIVNSYEFAEILKPYSKVPHSLGIENLWSFGKEDDKMSKTKLFSFAMSYGQIRGRIEELQMSHTLWAPMEWQTAVKSLKGKDAHVLRAYQLFKNPDLKGPKGKLLDGRADALLIAYRNYLWRTKGDKQ